MLAHISSYLLCLGLFSLLKFRSQQERIFSLFLTFLFCAVVYQFCPGFISNDDSTFTLLWDSSPAGDINLEIASNFANNIILLPFFAITLMQMLYIIGSQSENHKKSFISYLIFNLFCLVMLVTGNHFIQIIAFVFLIDILSQFLIRNLEAGQRYAVYNLIADLGLFWVLAILYGRVDSLDITHLRQYYQVEQYRDFIAILLFASLLVKMGFVFYQNFLIGLQNIRLPRLIVIPYLTSPAVALVLLVKFYPLLVVMPQFTFIFHICLLGVLSSAIYRLMQGVDLMQKMILLNIAYFIILIKVLEMNDFEWNILFSVMFAGGYCFNLMMSLVAEIKKISFMPDSVQMIQKDKSDDVMPQKHWQLNIRKLMLSVFPWSFIGNVVQMFNQAVISSFRKFNRLGFIRYLILFLLSVVIFAGCLIGADAPW